MQNKNLLISFLQAWGILLVVIGHSFRGWVDNNPIYDWIYSFHMPLFMFISGYLLRYGVVKQHRSLASTPLYGRDGFIWKKAKRLLIPYIVISSLVFIPKILLSHFAVRPIEFSFQSYIEMLIYPWDNVIIFFWFLPTLFLIFLIVVYGSKLLNHISIPYWCFLIILVGIHLYNPLSTITLFNLRGVINYLLYFALGYYCCHQNWEQHIQKHPYTITLLCGILSILLLFLPTIKTIILLRALNGIVFSIALGQIYIAQNWKFFHHLFGASYAIYLFSWFPQVASQQILFGLTHAPWWVGTILAIITGVYIPLFIYHWIIKHRDRGIGKIIASLTGHL